MPVLGIERTKTGAGDKTSAWLIADTALLKIITVIGVGFLTLFLYINQVKTEIWTQKHVMMSQKTKAENFAQDAVTQIMRLTVALEGHLAHEVEWERMDNQMVERLKEIQEETRLALEGAMNLHLRRLDETVEALVMNVDSNLVASVHDELVHQQEDMRKIMSQKFDDFMDQSNDVTSLYLKILKDDSEHNKAKMKEIHTTVADFAIKAGVRKQHGASEEDMKKKIELFFDHADAEYKQAENMQLPAKIHKQLFELLKNVDKMSHEGVVNTITKTLFPGGANEGASIFGVPHYYGGSVEAYIEKILFWYKYKSTLYPLLLSHKEKWKLSEITSFDMIEQLLEMVEFSHLPATWLLN